MVAFWFLMLMMPVQSELVTAKPDYESRLLTGYTRARATMLVVSEISARCDALSGDLGDVIGADGTFAQLDDTFTRLDLEVNGSRQEQARSRITYLKKEVARYEDLLKRQAIPAANYDEIAQQLDQAWLSLTELETQAKVLEERLSRHQVLAPSGWRIMERLVEPGAWVTAGTRVGKVGDFRTLLVSFHLDSQQFNWLRENPSDIPLSFPELGRTKVLARLLRFEPGFDEQTRKRRVDLVVDSDQVDALGGMRCEWVFRQPSSKGRLRLPQNALTQRFDTWWVVREDGERIRVTRLGLGDDGWVRLESPLLEAGMRFRVEAGDP